MTTLWHHLLSAHPENRYSNLLYDNYHAKFYGNPTKGSGVFELRQIHHHVRYRGIESPMLDRVKTKKLQIS